MRLWIVETSGGTRFVVYAHDAKEAVASLSEFDRDHVHAVREWPLAAPFRIVFEPVPALMGEDAVVRSGWDCLADWGDHPPPATEAALGDIQQALRAGAEQDERLIAAHDRGEHEADSLLMCPSCESAMMSTEVERRQAGRPKYDA